MHLRPALGMALAVSAVLPAAASAAIPSDLTTLPFTYFAGLTGSNEQAGGALAGGCDVNGDHRPDLIVGSKGRSSNLGGAYVVFNGADQPLGQPGTLKITTDATTGRSVGASVACGDVNGDGIDDIVLGGTGIAPVSPSVVNRGVADVIFGGADLRTLGTLSLADAATRGFRVDGTLGTASSSATNVIVDVLGDLDGDGRDEISVARAATVAQARDNSGRAFVIGGRTTTDPVDLDAGGALLQIDGAPGDQIARVVPAGDLNGDGVPELAVAALGGSGPLLPAGGAVFVFDGTARGVADRAAGSPAGLRFTIWGGSSTGRTGDTIAPAGDVNGDGIDDLLVASPGADVAHVVFGSAATTERHLEALGTDGFAITAPDPSVTNFGQNLAPAGDVNADGLDDVLVANRAQGAASGVYLIYGRTETTPVDTATLATTGLGARMVPKDGFPVTGALATATSYGQGLAATGDLDGDGLPDLAIGSHTGPLTSSPTTGRTGFVLVTHLPDPTPDTGTPPAVDPLVDWGIRANLRSYVYGAAATQDAPPIQATAGVTCYANPDAAVGGCDPRPMTGADYPSAFRWTPVGADLDVAEGEGTVATRGTVTLTYLAHCFTMRFSNPWWTIADGTATLAADVAVDAVEGCSPAGIPGGASPGDSQERITLGTFPLLGTATTTATTITWHTQPGALSAEGSAALGVLAPGAVLDPATITVPLGIGALPDPDTGSPPVVITVPGPATTVTVPMPSEAASGSAEAPAPPAAPATTPAPAAAPTRNAAPIRLTAKRTGKASKAGTRKVTITLPQAIGSDPEQFYGVWLTRNGTRVAVGRLRGTTLELTVSAVRRRVAGKVRTTYPPITGRYTLRPAAAGTAVPTITLTVR